MPAESGNPSSPSQLPSGQKYRQKSSLFLESNSDCSAIAQGSAEATPILASPRPYSACGATSSPYHNQPPSPPVTPMTDARTAKRPDRRSSASLPIPSEIPFYALPRASSNLNATCPGSQSDFDSDAQIPSPFCPSVESAPRTTDRPVPRCPEPASGMSCSPSSSSSASSYISTPASHGSNSDLLGKHSSTTSLTSSCQCDSIPSNNSQPRIIESSSESLPRPVSPFRAPQPPLHQQLSVSLLSQPTAIRRYMMPLHDTTSYPPPEPPVILPTENNATTNQTSFQSQAPYFPFLSHAPPPENSWIEVETLQNEYRLHVRLPGFTREGITLATKRKRILHVVADKWENGGGHFDRRISFGYDADLVQVRADFDGLMLRIMVPRRILPVSLLHTTARSTPPART